MGYCEFMPHLEKDYVISALVPYKVSPSGRNKYHSFILSPVDSEVINYLWPSECLLDH